MPRFLSYNFRSSAQGLYHEGTAFQLFSDEGYKRGLNIKIRPKIS